MKDVIKKDIIKRKYDVVIVGGGMLLHANHIGIGLAKNNDTT